MKKKESKKKRRDNFFKKNYSDSWNYVKQSKNFIFIIIGIFLIFALIGFFVPAPEELKEKITEFISELLEKTEGMNSFELSKFIFLNNLKVSFLGILLGVFFGLIPLVISMSNGYLIGYISFIVSGQEGIISLWKLFPHGVFELPAVFISLGLGLKLGTFIFKKEKILTLKNYFINSSTVFCFIIIPLLIVAAIIETMFIFLIG